MKSTNNIRIAIVGLALVAWVAACAQSNGMAETSMDAAMHDGMQKGTTNMLMGSGGHHAVGRVAFGMGMGGRHTLTLSDIDIDKVPDGYVYLTRGGDWMHGVAVGMLKQFSGSVSFDLPMGVDPANYDTVVVWCRKFKVEIGRAHYTKKMM